MSKTLKFKPELVDLILSGQKTTTWRLFDDKDLQVGDEVDIINSDSKEVVAHAILTEVRTKLLGEVEESDFAGHEKYESQDAMLTNFRSFYGDGVSLDTEVKIVDFILIQ